MAANKIRVGDAVKFKPEACPGDDAEYILYVDSVTPEDCFGRNRALCREAILGIVGIFETSRLKKVEKVVDIANAI